MLERWDGSVFATGRAAYLDRDPSGRSQAARIHVNVRFDEDLLILAVLDTGAEWSVVETEIANALGLLEQDGEAVTLSSRLGQHDGKLVRVSAELVAEEGDSIQVESTVFVCDTWPAGTFVGYNGLLERVRFAVDPDSNVVFFGTRDA